MCFSHAENPFLNISLTKATESGIFNTMPTCPKCHKTFDDSWKVCLYCNIRLDGIKPDGILPSSNPPIDPELAALENPEAFEKYVKNLTHVLKNATEHAQKCIIEYNGSQREIWPYIVDDTYVFAWCCLREDPRTFRLDNITAVGVYKEHFVKDQDVYAYLLDEKISKFKSARSYMEWKYKKEHNINKETGL